MFLQKHILFRLGSKDFQWTQVLGIFLGIITVLMLIKSAAVMFDSWQAISGFDACIESAGYESKGLSDNVGLDYLIFQSKANECKQSFYEVTGAQVPGGKFALTSRQSATAFVGPVAGFFFWAILFIGSLTLMFNKTVVIPIEEIETVARPFHKRK
jgi:hypothetical protein